MEDLPPLTSAPGFPGISTGFPCAEITSLLYSWFWGGKKAVQVLSAAVPLAHLLLLRVPGC